LNANFIRVQPVLVEKENIGWLAVISPSKLMTEEQEIALERGITILAIEVLKRRELVSMEEKYKGDFVDSLILNQNPDMIHRYSKEYQIDFTKPNRLIQIEFIHNSKSTQTSITPQRLEKIVSFTQQKVLQLLPNKSKCLITSKLKTIFIITPDQSVKRSDLEFLFQNLFSYQTYNPFWESSIQMVAISSVSFYGSESFGSIYSQNQKLLHRMYEINSNFQWCFFEDHKIKRLLLQNNDDDLASFLQDTLGPLLIDKKTNNELLTTLKTYIQSNGNWTFTKNTHFIHGNTLTQRIKRINHLLNMDLNKYDDRLKVQLALEIFELQNPYPNS
jgi:sugar diacid utilization regulator